VPAFFLNLLKILFLGFLYLFLWQIARSISAHLAPQTARRGTMRNAEVVVVRSDTLSGKRFTVGPATVIGRSPDADIVIDDPYASDFHVRLGFQDGEVMVHDLGSTNGTYVNGRRVTVPTTLGKGDSVQVGKTILEVR
jgi:pSer/pThr/pTyr-binding forkhead associated (FHA) protein